MMHTKKEKDIRFPLGTISISETLELCIEWLEAVGKLDTKVLRQNTKDGKQNKLANELIEIEQKLDKIKILPFLSLRDKMSLVRKILFEKGFISGNNISKIKEFEEAKFWDGLMFYMNITIEADEEELCIDNAMDIIMTVLSATHTGFQNVLLGDYRKFENMLDNMLFLESVDKLTNMLMVFDNEELSKNTAEISELINSMKKSRKLISDMATIATMEQRN